MGTSTKQLLYEIEAVKNQFNKCSDNLQSLKEKDQALDYNIGNLEKSISRFNNTYKKQQEQYYEDLIHRDVISCKLITHQRSIEYLNNEIKMFEKRIREEVSNYQSLTLVIKTTITLQ